MIWTYIHLFWMSTVFLFHWVGTPSVVLSVYSSELTENHQTYSRDCLVSNYYYETIQANVVTTGLYSFSSVSDIHTFGCIYENNNFKPFNPFEKVLLKDYGGCGHGQFSLRIYLQVSTTYVLVVTTFVPNVTGVFSILVSGPDNVLLNHSCEYLHCFMKDQHRSTTYRNYL